MKRYNTSGSDGSARPKAVKLSREALQSLYVRAKKFVEESVILRELVGEVQLARGRLYLWRNPKNLMARITPIGPQSMLLETSRGNAWAEHKRSRLVDTLKFVEGDTAGTFHGLGSLLAKRAVGESSPQLLLHQDLNIPVGILARPRHWYSNHRKPAIVEVNEAKDRALVRFVAEGLSGSFHGTCLYALCDGEWGCYTIKPSASASIASAEMWLDKRNWAGWN